MRLRVPPGLVWRHWRISTISCVVGMMITSVTPGLAQVPPVAIWMGATYVRAYGGGGVGPDMGLAVRVPGRLLGAQPTVGVGMAATKLPLVGPVGPGVDGDHRTLVVVAGHAQLDWLVARRFRIHVGGVLGFVESKVRSGTFITSGAIRPANRVGHARGMAVGLEGGAGFAVVPGLLINIAVAGLEQHAYADDPTFMPMLRLGVRVAPSW